jgi:hypothetical protein
MVGEASDRAYSVRARHGARARSLGNGPTGSGTADAPHTIMLASRTISRSVTLVTQLHSRVPRARLPRVIDVVAGGVLELVIQSVEGLRDRRARAK